jgi:anti-sigma B factor antagonist
LTDEQDNLRFHCRVEQRMQAVVVTVTGPIDLTTNAIFADAVEDAFKQQASSMVIDLAGVTFLASSGLAILVEAQENAMRAQMQLHVAVGNEVVERSIELTGLAQILSLVPDVQTALRS